MRIDGSVALVTGANRGLGLVLAGQLVARGARRVYAAARDPEALRTGMLGAIVDVLSAARGVSLGDRR